MKLTLVRKYKKQSYTIGLLYIDGEFFCNTLEDVDRGLEQDMSLEEIKKRKVMHETCIPYGTYEITMNVKSPKYSNFTRYPWAKECDGKLPRLLNVKGFDGILMHVGNKASDTDGCLLVGKNNVRGQVTNSKATFKELYKKLLTDKDNLTITITK